MAPAAREHGHPGAARGAAVAATLPFVAGADGVPRLPRISGAPPFTVKGTNNGKPGLDRGEFAGQQDGLRKPTVAQFLANRDQYDKFRWVFLRFRTRSATPVQRWPRGKANYVAAQAQAPENFRRMHAARRPRVTFESLSN